MINESDTRKSRKFLNSIEDYYDRIYKHTTPFYLSSLNNEKSSNTINYYCNSINNREIESLKNLYFDHDLKFENTKNVDYIIYKVETVDQFNHLKETLVNLPKKQLILEMDQNLQPEVSKILMEFGLTHSWFIFGKLIITINF
jgi:hypothetical protein